MKHLIHKQYDVEIKAVDEASHTVTAVVSTGGVDRDGEAIAPKAYESSIQPNSPFARNAVHLWAHDASKIENILGRAISLKVVPDGLLVTFQYAVEANPQAKMAFDLIQCGALSAFSVGFLPVSWVTPDDNNFPELKGKARRVYTEVELWEISLCAIPSNPEALVVGRTITTEETNDMAKDLGVKLDQAPALKIGHAPTNDIRHRLMGAIESLSAGYWDDPGDEPPEPETCFGIIRVLEQIVTDLKALAGADDDDEALAPVTSSAKRGATKSGQVLSSANQDLVHKLHGCLQEAVGHCETLKSAAGMSEDGDSTDNDEDSDGEAGEDVEEEKAAFKPLRLTIVP